MHKCLVCTQVSHGAGAIRRRPLSSGAALMRVAIIVVAVSLASVPALASPSCMTQSEARQKFPKEHLWGHAPTRGGGATPPSRQRLAQRIKAGKIRPVARDAEPEAVEEKK